MREKLVELMLECDKEHEVLDCFEGRPRKRTSAEFIADHLLANGVIVLPCKVGDTIYRCGDPIKKVYEWEVEHIEIYGDEIVFVDDSDNEFTEAAIGKTVFLTREEAEAALKEGQ